MGYSFYIVSRKKPITVEDYNTSLNNLSTFNKTGFAGHYVCDVDLDSKGYICVSGSYGMSGKYAEGFVLNLVINLIELGYIPKVLSSDWEYGTEEDWELL